MAKDSKQPVRQLDYVGTIVGESTSREFRLALAHESVREQDIIAVDADLQRPESTTVEQLRIWAKVQTIERVNPLFPHEAGHELAATQTHPLDTVLSLSREMVTAVCQVLGTELRDDPQGGRLDHLRYPAQPATNCYRPTSDDIARIVIGDLREPQILDIASLSNRPEVSVKVNGHAVVTRHLAILAMTGAGKTVTARRMIEELAAKHYPIVIFDPRGVDYAGLGDVAALKGKVRYFYATLPIFEEDADTVRGIVDTLGYELSPTMKGLFDNVYSAAKSFMAGDSKEKKERISWLRNCISSSRAMLGRPDMYLLGDIAEAAELIAREKNAEELEYLIEHTGWEEARKHTKRDANTLEGIKKRCRSAAKALRRMEETNKKMEDKAEPLPSDRTELVNYGQISVIGLAGYTSDFQATIYSLIADDIFEKRVNGDLPYRVLLLLEEAHNFCPGQPRTAAEKRAITTTKQIAQEGRKFGVGQILISQRPSRLDETTLSQCNSFVIMRLVNPADQSFVKRVIETLGEEEVKLLPDLDVGEALLSGQFINFPVLVRIKPPESQGEREEKDAFEDLEEAHAATQNASASQRKGR